MELAYENGRATAVMFVDTLYDSENNDMELRGVLRGIYLANNWKQNFAQAVFDSLRKAMETRRPMGDALLLIYNEVSGVVGDNEGFEKDPSTFYAVMALGILIVESPWVIRDLGFAEGGILGGERALPYHKVASLSDANVQARLSCGKVEIEGC